MAFAEMVVYPHTTDTQADILYDLDIKPEPSGCLPLPDLNMEIIESFCQTENSQSTNDIFQYLTALQDYLSLNAIYDDFETHAQRRRQHAEWSQIYGEENIFDLLVHKNRLTGANIFGTSLLTCALEQLTINKFPAHIVEKVQAGNKQVKQAFGNREYHEISENQDRETLKNFIYQFDQGVYQVLCAFS